MTEGIFYFGLLYDLCLQFENTSHVKERFPKIRFDDYVKRLSRLNSAAGTIVNAVRIVVDSFYKDRTIGEVIELGGDTDSNAALYGALYFINRDFPQEYKEKIRGYKYLEKSIDSFWG
jgi:hypothetical protein